MSTVFTFPGKIGDAILQWPVAFAWAKKTGQKFEAWLDKKTLGPIKPLFESEPCVESVKMIDGIDNYNCGGQPWHFNLESSAFEGKTIFHLGLRRFPARQITLETAANSRVPMVDTEDMCRPVFLTDVPPGEKKNRLILHGQAVYAHTRSSPSFWRFISLIKDELREIFDEIVFVGSDRDIAAGEASGFPATAVFVDGGNLRRLAEHIRDSRCMIGCGSSIAALSGALQIPTIRVHDPIGNHPKVIWSNLGENQLNATEEDLRTAWPEFRDAWLKEGVTA